SAATPASRTGWPLSSTARAAITGLRIRRTAQTAPAASDAPSMIDASSSCSEASFSAAPCPALKGGLSSITTTAACTASSAEPPARSTRQPARKASARCIRLSLHSGSLKRPRASVPQPPCRPMAISANALLRRLDVHRQRVLVDTRLDRHLVLLHRPGGADGDNGEALTI